MRYVDSALFSWLVLGWEGGDNLVNYSRYISEAIGPRQSRWRGVVGGLTLFSAYFTPLTSRVTDGG